MGVIISGIPLLDWALVALSSFNTLLPIWLGLTILLNAERRTWGVWLAGLGMLFTGAFFIFHTALLEGAFFLLPERLRSWWYVGWIPVILLPYGWYIALLWFGGYWERNKGRLHARHRFPFILMGGLALCVMVLLFTAERPSIAGGSRGGEGLDLPEIIFFINSPLPIIIYALYIVLTLLLSLDAIRRLEPSGRMIGDLARMRARPWLAAITWIQIGVSLLVTWAMFRLVTAAGETHGLLGLLRGLAWLDLAVSALIALSMYLLGKAIISYEIFTGKILPRQGLRRHWRNALILATGYGIGMSTALQSGLPAFYILLATTILIAIFYALLNWRSYIERDRYLNNLRPFVGSQQLYEHMVSALDSSRTDGGIAEPFRALCADVLGARLAYLVPLGPLAPLAGPPLAYPRGASNVLPWLADATPLLGGPEALAAQLDPERSGGAVWGIPLWSERGMIGAIFLGEKLEGGLYTQEELEIARASGERLIDLQAGAEMARRLVTLQRQRMAESQVMDARARRVLHDDVLPQIHASMLALSGGERSNDAIALMSDLHRRIADLLREMPSPVAPNLQRLGMAGALRQVIEGELKGLLDEVRWNISPDAEARAAALPPITAEVLYYAAREVIRNAARYGRRASGNEPLILTITLALRDRLILTIEDNGDGIDPSRPSDGGTGQGLALHGTMMAVVGGSLSIEGTRVVLGLAIDD